MPPGRKWVLGRRTAAERAQEHRGIILRDSLVQPKTLKQYYKYARKLLPIVRKASDEMELDELLADHMEEMWETGRPPYHAPACLCGLQFFMPWCQGKLLQTWKLFRIWRRLEVPCRAAPLPRDIAYAFALILTAFDGLLRTAW